jgi:signal transduction histidine kinase
MGVEAAELRADGRASARRWKWGSNRLHDDAGAALLLAGGAQAEAGKRPTVAPGDLLPVIRGRVTVHRATWLQALIAAPAALLALGFIAPIAGHAPASRATAESLITVLAVLSALALGAQFWRTRRLRDLILLGGFALFALVELLGGALPAALGIDVGRQLAATVLLGQLFVAAAIAAAAYTPSSQMVVRHRRALALTAGSTVLLLAAAQLGGLLLRSELSVGAARPTFGIGAAIAAPVALVVVLATSGLLACAADQLAQRGQIERDPAISLLAGAVVVMTAARLYFLALPSLPGGWVSPLQGIWLLAIALVAAAMVCQERGVCAGMMRAAALAERRRVASDLHDGLAQDLAFIATHGVQLAQEYGPDHPLAIAARRALALSRGAISELSDMRSVAPRDALEAIAQELRERFEMSIAIDADPDAELAPDSSEDVLRIAREAIANAGRHGHAKNVLVSLRATGDGIALRVRDDGCGMRTDPACAPAEGFGIGSMRERATALGGRLALRERGGGGIELEVVVPR